MARVLPENRVLLGSALPDVLRKRVVVMPKLGGAPVNGRSSLRTAPLRAILFHWTGLALGNLALHPFGPSRAASARSEVFHHLLIPGVVVEIVEPSGQGMTVILR